MDALVQRFLEVLAVNGEIVEARNLREPEEFLDSLVRSLPPLALPLLAFRDVFSDSSDDLPDLLNHLLPKRVVNILGGIQGS